jgi:hypothetical protein
MSAASFGPGLPAERPAHPPPAVKACPVNVYFTAVRRFDSSVGAEWDRYLDWSKLPHLREVISIDGILCPSIFRELTHEDWNHNVHENCKCDLMWDLNYVLARADDSTALNVLAIAQEPAQAEVAEFCDPRFVFRGSDLVEVEGSTSALVCCGGFDRALAPTDLSDCGLITDHARAADVQAALWREYPDEHHADTDIWAIWQYAAQRQT